MAVLKPSNSPYYHYDFIIESKRYRGSTKRTTKKPALAVEAVKRQEVLDRIQLNVHDEWTLQHAIGEWWKVQQHRLQDAKHTYNILKRLVGDYQRPSRKQKAPYALDAQMLLHAVNEQVLTVLVDHRITAGWSGVSINREITAFRSVWAFAQRRHVRVADIRQWPREKENKRVAMLSETDFQKLLTELEEYMADTKSPLLKNRADYRVVYSDLLVLLYDTGFRLSEALSVLWDDVDFDKRTISVYQGKTGTYKLGPLSDRLSKRLITRKESCSSAYVFPGRTGGPLTSSLGTLRKFLRQSQVVNSEARKAAYGDFTLHSFRHAYATKMLQQGLDRRIVQTLLGHASGAMTDRYTHLTSEWASERALEVLDR